MKVSNNIISIGLKTNREKNVFSGQSMMFDALNEYLLEKNYQVKIIDLSSKRTNVHSVGKISILRIIGYLQLIIKSIFIFIKYRKSLVYINTAQTIGGFARDYIFINLAKFFKCNIVIQHFGSNFNGFYDSLSSFFKRKVIKTFDKADVIIVEGDYTKEQFYKLKNYKEKIIPVSNGLPEKNLKITNVGKHYKAGDVFNLLYLSYLIESKGYWDVLEATNILINEMKLNVFTTFSGVFKSSVDDTRFTDKEIAKNEFFKYIKENKLEDNIKYFEGLTGDNKAREFLKSNVFILPSYFKFEGQPVSVLEALAYGAVPIVTKYRLIPDMVSEDEGVYVQKKSPRQIADSIKFLMNNEKIYHEKSSKGIIKYLNYFTLEKYCKNIEEIMKRLMRYDDK